MKKTERILRALSKSKFRNSMMLGQKELKYLQENGTNTIADHARDFVTQRIAPAKPKNDGKQTPFKGHPVFIAQHATATCCRKCLEKWHKIPKGKALNDERINYIVSVINFWIKIQISNHR